jgi:hypothetical protein
MWHNPEAIPPTSHPRKPSKIRFNIIQSQPAKWRKFYEVSYHNSVDISCLPIKATFSAQCNLFQYVNITKRHVRSKKCHILYSPKIITFFTVLRCKCLRKYHIKNFEILVRSLKAKTLYVALSFISLFLLVTTTALPRHLKYQINGISM